MDVPRVHKMKGAAQGLGDGFLDRPEKRRAIGEMRFLRQCRAGERITLEARLRAQDQESFTWDARGIDDQGRTIMQVRAMRLHRVSP